MLFVSSNRINLTLEDDVLVKLTFWMKGKKKRAEG